MPELEAEHKVIRKIHATRSSFASAELGFPASFG
jgi:hypothetical protein